MPETNPTSRRKDARPDYARLYREYWSRDDRWGTHSFQDPEAIVEQILSTCGGGPILDVGCGMGLLVRTLLRRGVDARGIDIAEAPIEEANRLAPGRFQTGSILKIPSGDGAFQTVLCTDLLEHIAEQDVPAALGELFGVSSRFCFVRLSVEPDRDNRWHLTVRDRDWWLERFFEAGFRRHPLAQTVVPYDAMRGEGWQITLVLEKAPTQEPCPAAKNTGVYARDVTREVGDDAERAIATVMLASRCIATSDRVLDAGEGVAWSASMLAACSPASEVVAHVRDSAQAWARERFASDNLRVDRAGELDEQSHGVIVSLGKYRQTSSLQRDLPSLARALEPGGRLVVDLPGSVTSEQIDAEAHGLLADAIYAMEPVSADDADTPGLFRRVQAGEPNQAAQRTLLVLMRDPVGASAKRYVERAFPEHLEKPGFHVANFARDLDNPWLLRAMVSVGMRGTNPDLNARIAQGTLDAARLGSADEGAALCVLAYRVLDADTIDPERAADLVARIDTYHARADGTPYAWRWRISNQYASALLRLALGQLEDAREAFLVCAEMDPTPYSPLLASKTVDAWYRAGLIDACAGRTDEARASWTNSLLALERSLKSDWLNVWGSPEQPLSFAMADLAILVDLGSRSSSALGSLAEWHTRPGPTWTNAHRQTLADVRRNVDRLERSRDWMDRQRAWLRDVVKSRDEMIERLRARIAELEATRDRLEQSRDHLLERQRDVVGRYHDTRDRLDQTREHVEQLREAIDRLTEAREFLRSQIASRDARLEAARHAELSRKENQLWYEHRLRTQQERTGQIEQQLQDRIARLEAQILAAREGSVFWKERFDEAKGEHEMASEVMQRKLAQRDEMIAHLRARLDHTGTADRSKGPKDGDRRERARKGSRAPGAKNPDGGATIAPEEPSGGVARVQDPARSPATGGPSTEDQAGGTDS